MNEARAPPAGRPSDCTLGSGDSPAAGSGNQMSIKGGVSKLGGPSEIVHPPYHGDRRPVCGRELAQSRNSGFESKTGLWQFLGWGGELLPRGGGGGPRG